MRALEATSLNLKFKKLKLNLNFFMKLNKISFFPSFKVNINI